MNKKERLKRALQFHVVDFSFSSGDEYEFNKHRRLVGHRDKDFFSMSSDKFSHMVETLTFDDSSYITHINHQLQYGTVPSRVSVLKKTINSDNYRSNVCIEKLLYSEVLSSQLLEYFDLPTPYNVAVKYNVAVTQDVYEVLSVDFLDDKEKFVTFDDLACIFENDLKENVRQIRYELNTSTFDGFSDSEKNKVIEDYVFSFFIRRYFLKDVDFAHNNCGLIVDKENGRLQYINFDFEYAFGTSRSRLKENLMYCFKEFPDVFDRLFDSVCECRNFIKELVNEYQIKFDNYFHRDYIEDFCYSVEGMYWTIKKMEYRKGIGR